MSTVIPVISAFEEADPEQHNAVHLDRATISIIVPVHNEAESLPELYSRVSQILNEQHSTWELILVNDGSKDDSAAIIALLHAEDPRVKGISLSRNFGFQIAVTAGLDAAEGDAVILMDADLQDPPEVIPDMIARWRAGYDVVYGVRAERAGETWFKKTTASAFYRLMERITSINIPVDTGDFRLMDRRVVDAIRNMPERHRFLRGMVSWAGYRQTGVTYQRHARFAGKTNFTLHKMLNFAADAITSFSYLPLQLASWLGIAFIVLSAIGLVTELVTIRPAGESASGWIGALAVLLVGGVQLVCIGILGEYLGRIYDEVKGRPLYLVNRRWGISQPANATK